MPKENIWILYIFTFAVATPVHRYPALAWGPQAKMET